MSGEESEEYEEEENDDEVIEDLENLEFKNQLARQRMTEMNCIIR